MILTTSITLRVYSPELRTRQARLLGVFVAAVLYFVLVHHLSNIYLAKKGAYESWILLNGGIYTTLFWVGQVLIGGIIPMFLLFHPKIDTRKGYVLLAALLVVIGGFAQLYVIIVGGQAFPLDIFPGFEVSSSFNDGVINEYTPTLLELALGLGGIALALMITGLAMKFLRIVPDNLSDDNVDPALLAD
jgi:molybdopterin-containing oxidoreductase family membrane subunit